MEDKLKLANEFSEKLYSELEKNITINAMNILKTMNLDETCLLSSILYYPYCKVGVVNKMDMALGNIEEAKVKELEKIRAEFKNNIKQVYGEEVLNFLHSLKKLIEIDYQNEQEEAENIRKMFFALAKDIRVIIVKLCFVLAELQVVSKDKTLEEQTKLKSKQTLELFAPLASRLGLSSIKSELEDLAFKNLYPEQYEKISSAVEKKYKEREVIVNHLKDEVRKYMKELGINGEVMGRKKHIFSIYKKLKQKNGNLDKIYDLVAVRAILNSVEDCYALLGKINSQVTPLQNRFKDYIAIPKSNGYQSLHTTVMFEGVPVEIQIRTKEMHRCAEFGIAAHWMYKEKRTKLDSLDERLGWIREIMEKEKQMTSEELIESLKVDIYDGEIFVQTPKGKVLHLPAESTAIDFAYAIHSDVGNKCIGAKVNGKMQPITKPLENGDIVEIITNPNSKGPSRDWLKIIKTPGARNKILQFFRKEMKDDNIKAGKTMLEQAIKNAGYSVSKITDKKYFETLLEKSCFSTIDEIFASIGYGSSSAKIVAGKLVHIYEADIEKNAKKEIIIHEPSENYNPHESSVNVKGVNNLLIKFAKCCCPIKGDDIVGFVSHGQGIVVHRRQCPNLSFFDPERLIEVNWK